ncbi:extracellular solute-binding protein [Sulfitobacter mediterraneus]|uniref:Sugar ABC transporter substrate-binding protein n=1 Tax=Sulfitobacter mediterraneus TaxID=83219 RepID=A0A061SWL4_9RHOB|nr:extracellular solute-binding protein [Sulfitobacter mediterraneus]KAJ04229.1 sugar ABC transporter substrate-binding protein [Sulfitobacter mediterraneus]MBM1311072.1 extracellular solute-binding protein [Sulfitobacter mediterraneus]MBM1314954.1 extracellular solute-binding protein [Sulfitobacter mediterraneus]MBM1323315.1 extracellular solute-binding protein [Sulfitobacter mediterraneus]MBM1327227.1 extracellular solute-binding protein [Sulfitobacter mediterraneus]
MFHRTKTLAAAVATSTLLASSLFAGELVINTDTSDPAPKAAFEALIAGFEAENPDVKVTWNLFDHEGYKTSIRNFLTADAPDLANWYAGNRMLPYVNAGLFEPVDDVWAEHGLNESLASAKGSMTIDGKIWGVPYTYYQWGVYYRKDLFEANNIAVPTNWDEFKAAGATLTAAGITPITIGTKYLWTAGGVFDYLNLRTNGYDFHMALTKGEVAWTDDRVRATMANWKELIDAGFFLENHAAYSWQEALAPMVQGDAAMYVMGNFAVAPLREAGLTDDQLGFFQFPVINPDVPLAEEAPTDTIHIPANAKNKEDAKKFLAYLARADVQTQINDTLGQLPINSGSSVGDDKFLQAGYEMLSSTTGGIAQFFDRDAPAEMAKAGMEGFQEFMVKPERLDAILERLEKVRGRVYK